MPKITSIRPVLLSAPYGTADNLEVRYCLPSGYRTCGLVEVTLDDGTTGIGEGYLAVFAPQVFAEIVTLVAPHLIDCDATDIAQRYRDLCRLTGYWSLQGAARHVVSAIEIALIDAESKRRGQPAWEMLQTSPTSVIDLYGSGGDAPDPSGMHTDLAALKTLGIELFKIRARAHEIDKTVWVLEEADRQGVRIGIDMCQNLAVPPYTVDDVVAFLHGVAQRTSVKIAFLEEPLGPNDLAGFRELRRRLDVPITGGEIITTADELCMRLEDGMYDWVQPDATVVGGMHEVGRVFEAAARVGATTVVHCWGGGACLMANYHTAFAHGATLAEWPLPAYPLRAALLKEPLTIEDGRLYAPTRPGLGLTLTPEIEAAYPFRADAVYTVPATLSALAPWSSD